MLITENVIAWQVVKYENSWMNMLPSSMLILTEVSLIWRGSFLAGYHCHLSGELSQVLG